MAKLIDNTETKVPIGKDGLLAFIDELNEKRQKLGLRQRYKPVLEENPAGEIELTMATCLLANHEGSTFPSTRYSARRLIEQTARSFKP